MFGKWKNWPSLCNKQVVNDGTVTCLSQQQTKMHSATQLFQNYSLNTMHAHEFEFQNTFDIIFWK